MKSDAMRQNEIRYFNTHSIYKDISHDDMIQNVSWICYLAQPRQQCVQRRTYLTRVLESLAVSEAFVVLNVSVEKIFTLKENINNVNGNGK